MLSTISGASRPVLAAFAMLALSACSTTMTPRASVPSDTAGGMSSMTMKEGMSCPCCGQMKDKASEKSDCCSDMKDDCPCCAGMSGGKGMMCPPKEHK